MLKRLHVIGILFYMHLIVASSAHIPQRTQTVISLSDDHQALVPFKAIELSPTLKELATNALYLESATTIPLFDIGSRYKSLKLCLGAFAYWLTMTVQQTTNNGNHARKINELNIVPLIVLSDMLEVPRLKSMFLKKCANLVRCKKITLEKIPDHLAIAVAKEYYVLFHEIIPAYEDSTYFSFKELASAQQIRRTKDMAPEKITLKNKRLASIEKFPRSYFPTTLKTINLSHNKLFWLPEELRQYIALENLILADNAWITLSTTTLPVPTSLKKLDLSSNALELVEPGFLKNTPILEELNLRGNKLSRKQLRELGAQKAQILV